MEGPLSYSLADNYLTMSLQYLDCIKFENNVGLPLLDDYMLR